MIRPNKSDFSSVWKEWLKEIATSKGLTQFEPEVESISNIRIGQARYILGKLAKSTDDSFIKFPQSYGRKTTLAGIGMFLEKDHQKEYLVTAFGKRKGRGADRPAQFYGVHISHGLKHNVNFSHACIDYLEKHVDEIKNAEVLICHNHPRNFITDLLSQIVDWSPLPSNMDSETMYQFKCRSFVNWLKSGSFSRIRFYLFENGGLREIQLPSINRISQMLEVFTK